MLKMKLMLSQLSTKLELKLKLKLSSATIKTRELTKTRVQSAQFVKFCT